MVETNAYGNKLYPLQLDRGELKSAKQRVAVLTRDDLQLDRGELKCGHAISTEHRLTAFNWTGGN